MSDTETLEWDGREYDHVPKKAEWYYAISIVAVAGVVASFLFGEYLLAFLILLAAVVLELHAAKQPPTHHFQLTDRGLLIGEELHPFKKMISFSFLEDPKGEFSPLLSIKNDSWISPHLVIPLEGVDVEAVYAFFSQQVEEAEHAHSFSDLVAAWLGF